MINEHRLRHLTWIEPNSPVNSNVVIELATALLELYKQEHFCYLRQLEQAVPGSGANYIECGFSDPAGFKVFARPTPQFVPDELDENDILFSKLNAREAVIAARYWNACRAAFIAGGDA
ncbi:hypothetical protein N6P31_12390 [Pectobacterium betavasculorum]|uniref:hypothetical protein n=1 Tax=Pectobacterium betavasculorum TaxID=55207 RepID=UPI00313DBFB8